MPKPRNLGEQIVELREQGLSYLEISNQLNCSKGSVAYHLGDGQKNKTSVRRKKQRQHLLKKRFEDFSEEKELKPEKSIKFEERQAYHKARDFQKDLDNTMKIPVTDQFNMETIYEVFENDPVCYLTGRPVDLRQPKTYEFDHIIPRSKGGSSKIDNLGLTTKDANRAKGDMNLEDFLQLCVDVLKNYDIIE